MSSRNAPAVGQSDDTSIRLPRHRRLEDCVVRRVAADVDAAHRHNRFPTEEDRQENRPVVLAGQTVLVANARSG
jgi:hypothetical protein